ncbi:MAG TPA: hypothetical protein VLK60_03570 [Variovorax sp.]|nr:hypothetical protein [Variovorax sp.]
MPLTAESLSVIRKKMKLLEIRSAGRRETPGRVAPAQPVATPDSAWRQTPKRFSM